MMKRIHARICVIAAAFGLVMMTFSSSFGSHKFVVLWLGTGLVISSYLIKFFLLRCPSCGMGGAVPQWSKNGTIHCPKCGSPFVYDK